MILREVYIIKEDENSIPMSPKTCIRMMEKLMKKRNSRKLLMKRENMVILVEFFSLNLQLEPTHSWF